MDKYFADINGKVDWCTDPCEKKKNVRFPLCMAVKYHDDIPFICADFLLNATKKKAFVKTENPLPLGANVLLHFYIPPDKKLLGEFKGKVIGLEHPVSHKRGNYIKIKDFLHMKLDKLEEYLEERRRLVDVRV